MKEIFIEFLNGLIPIMLPICGTLLTALMAYLGTKINFYFKNKKVDRIIPSVVKYVEQIYVDLHGEEKFEKAVIIATSLLKEQGITISKDELKVMIESACYELKVSLTK